MEPDSNPPGPRYARFVFDSTHPEPEDVTAALYAVGATQAFPQTLRVENMRVELTVDLGE